MADKQEEIENEKQTKLRDVRRHLKQERMRRKRELYRCALAECNWNLWDKSAISVTHCTGETQLLESHLRERYTREFSYRRESCAAPSLFFQCSCSK